ncbi:MAG: hypothetical protein KKF46_02050 [Nanoarchaeota archaeon]|nr:hypothetical protein [Nanoarchaeota archaeon]MBU1321116.1 hypothetical protein [Nanoarchaeota archaeon]MBU1598408.1 hypothetical protein [Nanoarchaeota archaeon]MBU2440873.1 hypothetical protein [Nanoarchaeota archaeon]
MNFDEFRQTALYELFAKPMKVSAAIYFMDKNGGVPESNLELELRDDVSTDDIRSALHCLEVLGEVDYDNPELEMEKMYRLTPVAYEGIHGLISLLEEARDR